MEEWLYAFVQGFITLFIVFDPIGNIPLFQSFTSSFDENKKKKIINDSVKIALIILTFFAIAGFYVLELFRISIDDFRIAGGILLFIMAIEGLLGKEEARWISREDVAIVPLATPLMAGPGSIYTVMYLMQLPNGPFITFFALTANVLLQWSLLLYSDKVLRLLGKSGSTILSRIMAFILAGIAISMIRMGLLGAYLSG